MLLCDCERTFLEAAVCVRLGPMLQGQYASRVHTKQILIHSYIVVETVCKSQVHDVTMKTKGHFCPCFVTEEFEPGEFHTTCCQDRKTVAANLQG